MKTVIRKGLFETSSSSEDSLSIYQEMKLYILPKDIYNRFISGEIYVRFGNNIHPEWSDDILCVDEANSKPLKEYGLMWDNGKLAIGGYVFNYLQYLYVNYKTFTDVLYHHFSEHELFNYEDGNDMIFGYYGYTED